MAATDPRPVRAAARPFRARRSRDQAPARRTSAARALRLRGPRSQAVRVRISVTIQADAPISHGPPLARGPGPALGRRPVVPAPAGDRRQATWAIFSACSDLSVQDPAEAPAGSIVLAEATAQDYRAQATVRGVPAQEIAPDCLALEIDPACPAPATAPVVPALAIDQGYPAATALADLEMEIDLEDPVRATVPANRVIAPAPATDLAVPANVPTALAATAIAGRNARLTDRAIATPISTTVPAGRTSTTTRSTTFTTTGTR
jgi:hypothetical protein